MKRCSTSLIIREMQMKTIIRYHLTPVRTAILNKSSAGEDVGERTPCTPLVGMQASAATVENSMEFPQKIENGTACDPEIPLLGIYPRKF